MSALLVGIVWTAAGVVGAATDRYDRSAAWLLAGALLGPLWIPVRVDRRRADSLALATFKVSRLAPDRRFGEHAAVDTKAA